MIFVLTCLLILPVTWTYVVIVGFMDPNIKTNFYFSAYIIGCIGECSWALGCWALLFKYW